jgi:hypothetical protein
MVNYLYDLETIESNHEAFVKEATVVRSAEVDALLAASAPAVGSPRRKNRPQPSSTNPPSLAK